MIWLITRKEHLPDRLSRKSYSRCNFDLPEPCPGCSIRGHILDKYWYNPHIRYKGPY